MRDKQGVPESMDVKIFDPLFQASRRRGWHIQYENGTDSARVTFDRSSARSGQSCLDWARACADEIADAVSAATEQLVIGYENGDISGEYLQKSTRALGEWGLATAFKVCKCGYAQGVPQVPDLPPSWKDSEFTILGASTTVRDMSKTAKHVYAASAAAYALAGAVITFESAASPAAVAAAVGAIAPAAIPWVPLLAVAAGTAANGLALS